MAFCVECGSEMASNHKACAKCGNRPGSAPLQAIHQTVHVRSGSRLVSLLATIILLPIAAFCMISQLGLCSFAFLPDRSNRPVESGRGATSSPATPTEGVIPQPTRMYKAELLVGVLREDLVAAVTALKGKVIDVRGVVTEADPERIVFAPDAAWRIVGLMRKGAVQVVPRPGDRAGIIGKVRDAKDGAFVMEDCHLVR